MIARMAANTYWTLTLCQSFAMHRVITHHKLSGEGYTDEQPEVKQQPQVISIRTEICLLVCLIPERAISVEEEEDQRPHVS